MISIPQNQVTAARTVSHEAFIRSENSSGQVLAVPEVFVLLSCLDFLRQYTFRLDYPSRYVPSDGPGFKGSRQDVMWRVDQCVERLRGAFMCRADVTPILFELHSEGKTGIDLPTIHSCRGFGDILSWASEHIVEPTTAGQGSWKLT
jgi:hypothetical protein